MHALGDSVGELVDHLFRREAGRIASRLTRVFGAHRLDLIEDTVQHALLQALQHWPFQGIPDNPPAWLSRVASNRALDAIRAERRLSFVDAQDEDAMDGTMARLALEPAQDRLGFDNEIDDEQLSLMFVCCHPALPRAASVALTLKVVCGFGVGEIARAFLSNEATVAQRLVRAKRLLREQGIAFERPAPEGLSARLDPVLEVLYLLFTEGYTPSDGDRLIKGDLCDEALHLTGLLVDNAITARPECHALRALMMFQAARFASRTDAAGDLLLLDQQDRGQWNQQMIAHGLLHMEQAASGDRLTSYHLQAEIAAIHALSTRPGDTPWTRILELYDLLSAMQPSAVVLLNRAIALGKVRGPAAGLAELRALPNDDTLRRYPFLPVAQAEFLRALGDHASAVAYLDQALALARTDPEHRFILRKRADLASALQYGRAS